MQHDCFEVGHLRTQMLQDSSIRKRENLLPLFPACEYGRGICVPTVDILVGVLD